MVNQPLFQLGIGPSRPNHVGGIVIVHFHLFDKNIAAFLVVRLDDIVRYEPVMLISINERHITRQTKRNDDVRDRNHSKPPKQD